MQTLPDTFQYFYKKKTLEIDSVFAPQPPIQTETERSTQKNTRMQTTKYKILKLKFYSTFLKI